MNALDILARGRAELRQQAKLLGAAAYEAALDPEDISRLRLMRDAATQAVALVDRYLDRSRRVQEALGAAPAVVVPFPVREAGDGD